MDGSADNTSYAPESPDLSNYYAPDILSPVQTHHPQYYPSLTSPYAHTSFPQHPQQAFNYTHNQSTSYSAPDHHQYPDMAPRSKAPKHEAEDDHTWAPEGGIKKLKVEENGRVDNVDLGINVRTKFPVARIKRIMQHDDDVGKVAQVTPVVVSKALELFMINLVSKAATEAKAKNSKRVIPVHLKQAVMKDTQFDFLEEIFSKVADAPAAAEKAEDDDAPAESKKRKSAPRRKRKESTDSD